MKEMDEWVIKNDGHKILERRFFVYVDVTQSQRGLTIRWKVEV